MKKLTFTAMLLAFICCGYAQRAASIHEQAIVVDTHGDIMFNQVKSGIDVGKLQSTGNFDLVRARQGGLDVQVFSIWCDASGGFDMANRQIDSLNNLVRRYPDKIAFARTAADLQSIVKQGKMAAMIGVEGGHMIENSLDKLNSLAERGMTYLTLTWNNSTSWGSSAADESSGKMPPEKAGLNDFGKQVVQRLNKLGVLVDLSHVGVKTFFDAIATSTKPVLVSHSCVYSIAPVPRNLTDEQIRAVGKNGGVISLNFYSGFLDPEYPARQKMFLDKYAVELKALTQQYGGSEAIDTLILRHQAEADALRPPLSKLIDHVDYIVKMIGIDHVGMGADFDGAESFPMGMDSVADYPKITAGLLKRGYNEQDIYKIMGGNFIRLLKENKGQ